MATPHVFVTMGDLLNFKCNAWLLPTDARLQINAIWTDALPELLSPIAATNPGPFAREEAVAVPLSKWPVDEPLPVLTAVPLKGVKSAEELRPRFRAFLNAAAAAMKHRPSSRPLPLLGVPFFGTGHGAGGIYRGDILRVLLEEANSGSTELGVDIAFVFQDPAAYSLAQQQLKGKCR